MKREKLKRLSRRNLTAYLVDQNGNFVKVNRPLPTRTNLPAPMPQKKFSKNDPKRSIFVWVNTYNRPEDLRLLLNDIYKNKSCHKIKVLVIDDASELDYDKVLDSMGGKLNIEYHKMDYNHGKKKYWKLCTYAMNEIRDNQGYDYYVKLDDDGRIVDRFFDRCCNIWESINDNRKICLNFRLDSREGKRVWTNIRPIKEKHNGISVYKSQWVDMDFFTTISMFSVLQYRITKQPVQRWRNPYASSGTGRDISTRLVSMGYNLYLTTQSLVKHDEHNSHMNPREREKNPLITKSFSDPSYGVRRNG